MTARRYQCSWDAIPYINVSELQDDGTLEPGDWTLVFDTPGLEGDMVVITSDDRRLLTTFYRWHDAENVTRATVAIDYRPCRFGGSRPFLICPACQKRVMNLALLPRGLRCGPCGRITYQKRWDTDLSRRVRNANEVAARLGGSTWMDKPVRPKGMHRRTFERLLAERDRRVAMVHGTPYGVRAMQRFQRQGIRF